MAKHVHARVRRGFIVATAFALAIGLSPASPAFADPADPEVPTNSADAKDLWIDAANQAAALNEQVLQADEDVAAAAVNVSNAEAAVTSAADAVTAAEGVSTTAKDTVASYTERVNAFANASFKGARLSQFSSLLTADSAEDFLDEVSALDRVAENTSDMLAAAAQAKVDADAAQAQVEAKKVEADAAKTAAQTASDAAVTAQASLATSKTAMDVQVADYETLYNQLTEEERQAAIKAEEERLERLAAQAAAQAAAAAAAAVAATPGTDAATGAESAAVDAAALAAPGDAAAPAADAQQVAAPAQSAPNSAAAAAVAAALSKEGSRYVYGAAGPSSFDCSGLTSWAWAQAGVSIPRTSRGQAGLQSVPLDQLQPGDLVTYYSPVSHVAMYIGDGMIIHASTESKPVYITTVAKGGPNPSGHRP